MNFLSRNLHRFPVILTKFIDNTFPQILLSLDYQLVGPFQPNYGNLDNNNNNDTVTSVFDEAILRMAVPKSKVGSR